MELAAAFGLAAAAFAAAQMTQSTPPVDSRQLRQTALTLEQQGKVAEAEEAWRTYLKANPSSPEPYAQLGLLEARQGHYAQAIPLYRKSLAINPNIVPLRLDLGLALFKSGNMKEAIPEFVIVLQSNPGNQQVTTLLGMAHYGLAQYKEAVPYLRDAAQRDPQNLPLRLALAHSCQWSKQYQCVMDTYHEILALNAESAEADMIAGEALDEMSDNAGAVQQFRAAEKANPREPNVHFGLGYLLWAQKRYPEASEEFKAELGNDPNHIQAMEYLADSEVQLNQVDAAKPLLLKVARLSPDLALVHLDLGIVYSDADQKPDALRELSRAEKLKPDDIDVHWRLGQLYRSMGKRAEAMAEYDKARDLDKSHTDENFRRIANANAPRGGAAPTPAGTAATQGDPPAAPAPSAPPNQ
jgi:tetratricopeptide (TPR) repeat protein